MPVEKVHISDEIRKYIAQLVFATRYPERYDLKEREYEDLIEYGASPRGLFGIREGF